MLVQLERNDKRNTIKARRAKRKTRVVLSMQRTHICILNAHRKTAKLEAALSSGPPIRTDEKANASLVNAQRHTHTT